MVREFSIVRELSRREVERHTKRFVGITIDEPRFTDQNGLSEWVCDIRIGVTEGWAVIKDCLIAQWAVGAITDVNIPVLAERSEAGRVTIIARSELRISDEIRLKNYNYEDLDFGFMRNLKVLDDDSVVDGFGYEFAPAGSGEYTPPPAPAGRTHTFHADLVEWGGTDFEYGETRFGRRSYYWTEEET